MKKTHAAYAAGVLIILIILLLIVRVWSADRAVSFEGPTQIHMDGNGIIYILSNNTFYLHDKDGELLDIIPVKKFGIEQFIGDFWVYQNGDILMRRPIAQKLTISGEVEMFARTGAGEQDRLPSGESALQRCSTTTFTCKTFGVTGEVYDKITPFHLYVDEKSGLTYLADTIAHRLLLLDEQGTIIKRSDAAFLFPNELALEDDGLLYLADTNNHRVAAVSTAKEDFGAIKKQFIITHHRNPVLPTWPMELVRTQDRKWWVINADDGMRDGTIMIHNEKGEFEKIVRLPPGADPLRFTVVDDRVLVTDTSLMRVYAVALNGNVLNDFGSLTFKLDLSELRRQKNFYDALARTSMWALLVLLAASFIVARQARLVRAEQPIGQPEQAQVTGMGDGTKRYDYHSILSIQRIKFAVLTVLLLTAFAFIIMISRGLTVWHKQFMPVTLLGHFTISLLTYLQLKRSYVELTEQGITFQGMTRIISSPWRGVRKVVVYGRTCKVVTDHGNFSIGSIEPAGSAERGWLDLLKRARYKFLKELVEEIQQRSPTAKITISWLIKYQWRRL